jgi:hypothetical protein
MNTGATAFRSVVDSQEQTYMQTDETNTSQTITHKPSKFTKFLSGMATGNMQHTMPHSKSSNDLNSTTQSISGSVSMSINAASSNILNLNNNKTISSSTSIQSISKKNKLNNGTPSNVNSNNNVVLTAAARLLNSLTSSASSNTGQANKNNFKIPKSFSSFNIKQSNNTFNTNNDPCYNNKLKHNLGNSMNGILNSNKTIAIL